MLSGKAYAPEFYYDARSALWQNRPRAYGFKLQWTQMEPGAVDRILAYRLGFRQVGLHNTGLGVRLVPELLCPLSDGSVSLVGATNSDRRNHPEGGAADLQPD